MQKLHLFPVNFCREPDRVSRLLDSMIGNTTPCPRFSPILLICLVALSNHAAMIWDGPLFTYNQPAANPTQATNQDRITPDVWLTRAASKGLFNAFYETNATALSPTNTEWAFGTLSNYVSLPYTNWLAMLNGQSPTTLVNQPLVVHFISDDIYVSLQFTQWVAGGSGGFAYQRSTPRLPIIFPTTTSVSDGQFHLSYSAYPGIAYVVQSSSNLVDWSPLTTNIAASSLVFYSSPPDFAGTKFFRVAQLPNP